MMKLALIALIETNLWAHRLIWGMLNCEYVKGVAYLHMVRDFYYLDIQVKLYFRLCIKSSDLL